MCESQALVESSRMIALTLFEYREAERISNTLPVILMDIARLGPVIVLETTSGRVFGIGFIWCVVLSSSVGALHHKINQVSTVTPKKPLKQ